MSMRTILLNLFLIAGVSMMAQKNDILLKIGNENVSLSEFERIYSKNNNENSLNRQTPEEYLELFINFKLKVLEAESLGMDTTNKFITELNTYKSQLAEPYLTDDSIRELMIVEAYERAQYDIHASHILLILDENASPEDTLAKYEKAMEIRQRIVDGEPFEKVARATSEDASVKRNGGDLNYFTVFRMIYPFETAAYNTPVGDISMPVRTSFGYHLIKVHDRRPARGQVKVAHIFIRVPENMPEEDKAAAWNKIQMVYDSLEAGVDFKRLAQSYSEDPNSANNGGEMPWFGTGRMIPVFEDACYAIENIGDYTKPLKTFYGWHIIKLIDKKPIGTFEEMKPQLTEQVNRGDRAKHKSDMFVNKLKDEYGYSVNTEALEYFASQLDSTAFNRQWKIPETLDMDMHLLTIGDKEVSLGDFAQYVQENQPRNLKPHAYITFTNNKFKAFEESVVRDYEEANLPDKYPEFRYIVEEYHDGILLFDIMDERVWTKAVADTTGLEAFHKAHKSDYMWGERYEAQLIECDSTVNLAAVRKQSKKLIAGKLSEEKLNDKFCVNDSIPCIKVTEIIAEEGDDPNIDAMNGQIGMGEPFAKDDATAFIVLTGIRKPEPKELNEARGQITSDYQNFLEKQWIEELKAKYPVEVNKELLSKVKQ